MNKFYLAVIAVLFFNLSFANPVITAKQTGSWSDKNTWDKARTPADADTIIIPAGKTVSFDSWLTTETLKNVFIKVYGSLKLGGFFSSLSLDNNSSIIIYSGGTLSSSGAWQNLMLAGQQIFASSYPSIAGPQIANTGSNGFTGFNPLPVKFVGFTVTMKAKDALIQWATSEEMNANIYEVERSFDGNTWNTIAYVAATGNSSSVSNYSYTDKNLSAKLVYYRIKEVDIDGKTSVTSIKSVRQDISSSAADIKIASIQNKVLLQFPQQVTGSVLVRFVSVNGQVADQQSINNPVGQVVLNSKLTGIYIISISNGQQINTAKQVML